MFSKLPRIILQLHEDETWREQLHKNPYKRRLKEEKVGIDQIILNILLVHVIFHDKNANLSIGECLIKAKLF